MTTDTHMAILLGLSEELTTPEHTDLIPEINSERYRLKLVSYRPNEKLVSAAICLNPQNITFESYEAGDPEINIDYENPQLIEILQKLVDELWTEQ